jgi:hypothetical protein
VAGIGLKISVVDIELSCDSCRPQPERSHHVSKRKVLEKVALKSTNMIEYRVILGNCQCLIFFSLIFLPGPHTKAISAIESNARVGILKLALAEDICTGTMEWSGHSLWWTHGTAADWWT